MKNLKPLFQCLLSFLLLAFSLNGHAQSWEKIFPQNGLSRGFDVVETPDGGYVMCGELDLPTGAIRHYIQVLKTDADGNEQWSHVYNYNAISNDGAKGIVITPDDGFLIVGTNIEGNVQLLRIDSSGDSLWTKEYAADGLQTAEAIIPKSTGAGYLIAGSKVTSPDISEQSFWIASIDDEGVLLWEQTYDELAGLESRAVDIKSTANGEYLVVGTFIGSQLAVLRIAANGNQIWAKKYILSTADFGLAISEMTDGSILVGGYSTGFAGNVPSLLHLSSIGEEIAQPVIDLVDLGAVTDIEQTSDGGYILTGSGFSFWYNVDSDNGFILKLDSDLEPVWDSLLLDTRQGSAILETSDGGYIMSGFDGNSLLLKKIGGMTNSIENTLLENELAVMVYPNPTTEKLIFEIPIDALTRSLSINIYNVDGRLIKSQPMDEGIEIIPLEGLVAGNYAYVIAANGVVVNSGVVVVL